MERLREIDAEHRIHESVKPGPGGSISVMLTPLELIERLAAWIPPPPRRHRHRHRYVGVLAPNAPLRAAVTALAGVTAEVAPPTAMAETASATVACATVQNTPEERPPNPPTARPRVASGHSCWRASMKCCRSSPPSAAATCGSSPASTMAR
ncbi:hypothetical protein [Candidatus Accumulibacter phosphatis]|uniref:hypothetical protein n=1 Tax=Candidatus Accumulibacter phosphatis TaxID=327160 RepID=UPI003D7C1790